MKDAASPSPRKPRQRSSVSRQVAKHRTSSQPLSTADDARSIHTSLRRTQNLLQHELERVSHVTQVLGDDGKILKTTQGHHLGLQDASSTAKKALTGLERQKQKERWVFLSSVGFFYLVVLYVVWTRIRIPFFLW